MQLMLQDIMVPYNSATSVLFYTGRILFSTFLNCIELLTNDSGIYCSTPKEDSAILNPLLRAARFDLVDFSRIIVMSAGSNLDRPPYGTPILEDFF